MPRLLSAEDLSCILKQYKLDDSKVTIIGCPNHLFKSLLEDKNKRLKAYICHIKNHWFMVFYVRIKNSRIIITWDSFGNMLPYSYRSKIMEFDKNIDFKYCSASLQKDNYSCGLFCITFILIIFDCYKNNKKNFLENVNKIQKLNVIQKLNNIKKVL
jgi:hypothetical protein